MVYETDFYTTRRPYARPSVSSYTSTVPPRYIRSSCSPLPSVVTYAMPRFTRAQSPIYVSAAEREYRSPSPATTFAEVPLSGYRRPIPFVAHKRVTPSVHTIVLPPRMRTSSMIAEMDRISHRSRPSVASRPSEDFLNTRAIVSFDDETRAIRARTNELLKRVNTPLPRSYHPDYQPPKVEEVEPLSHDAYIEQRVFMPMRHVHQDISTMSHWAEPGKQYIGKGHLACISFAGGRPIARRRALPRSEEDRNVRDDVKFLSYYNRARAGALGPEATLESIKALLAPPYHRRDPQPELVPLPFSRPRAPASCLARITAAHRDRKSAATSQQRRRPLPASPTSSNSKELVRARALAEKDQEAGRIAFAECQQAKHASQENDPDQQERAARRKQREMEAEELARQEVEEMRAKRAAARKAAELEQQTEQERQEKLEREAEEEAQAEIERKEEEQRNAERIEKKRQAEIERQAEAERQAEEDELEQQRLEAEQAEAEKQAEAERLAESEREAELERQEAEKNAEAEKQAELERQEAEKIAEAEKQAELERQEAEKKAEAEKQAEAERQAEAEKQAELERQAEAERQAELERQAQAEKEAAVAVEEAPVETAAAPEEESAPAESDSIPAPAEETPAEETPAEESVPAPVEEAPAAAEEAAPAPEVTEPPAAEAVPEETTAEPVVEEPQSPEQPLTNGSAHAEDGPTFEELEISLEGDSADTVVRKAQEAAQIEPEPEQA